MIRGTGFITWWRAFEAMLREAGHEASGMGVARPYYDAGLTPGQAFAREIADQARMAVG